MMDFKEMGIDVNETSKAKIIEQWDRLGFLDARRMGSITAWRVAKSLQDAAIYLTEHADNKYINQWKPCILPIIRRCIMNDRCRIGHAVDVEDLFNFLRTTSVYDVLRYVKRLHRNNFGYFVCGTMVNFYDLTNGGKYKRPSMFLNCGDMSNLDDHVDDALITFMDFLENSDRMYLRIIDLDLEAEMAAIVSEYYSLYTKGKITNDLY